MGLLIFVRCWIGASLNLLFEQRVPVREPWQVDSAAFVDGTRQTNILTQAPYCWDPTSEYTHRHEWIRLCQHVTFTATCQSWIHWCYCVHPSDKR